MRIIVRRKVHGREIPLGDTLKYLRDLFEKGKDKISIERVEKRAVKENPDEKFYVVTVKEYNLSPDLSIVPFIEMTMSRTTAFEFVRVEGAGECEVLLPYVDAQVDYTYQTKLHCGVAFSEPVMVSRAEQCAEEFFIKLLAYTQKDPCLYFERAYKEGECGAVTHMKLIFTLFTNKLDEVHLNGFLMKTAKEMGLDFCESEFYLRHIPCDEEKTITLRKNKPFRIAPPGREAKISGPFFPLSGIQQSSVKFICEEYFRYLLEASKTVEMAVMLFRIANTGSCPQNQCGIIDFLQRRHIPTDIFKAIEQLSYLIFTVGDFASRRGLREAICKFYFDAMREKFSPLSDEDLFFTYLGLVLPLKSLADGLIREHLCEILRVPVNEVTKHQVTVLIGKIGLTLPQVEQLAVTLNFPVLHGYVMECKRAPHSQMFPPAVEGANAEVKKVLNDKQRAPGL